MRYLALLLCVGCAVPHGNEHAPVVQRDTHENAYSDGRRPGSVIVKSLLGAGAISLSGSASKLGPGATGDSLVLTSTAVADLTVQRNAGINFDGDPHVCGTAGSGVSLCSTAGEWSFYGGSTLMARISGSGTITSNRATGNDAFAVAVNGARVHFGAGATDFASSDGTTVTFAGPIATSSGLTIANNAAVGAGTTNKIVFSSGTGTVTSIANNPGTGLAAFIANSSGALSGTDKIFSAQNNSVEKAFIDLNGASYSSALVGTAASGTGITANYSGALRSWVHKVTVINTALAAASTSDVTLAVTPVNSRIIRVTADVTQVFTGGALSAMTVMCGNSAGGNQYLLANSVFTAQNTWGDAAAEVGAGLLTATWADFGTSSAGVPGAITVQCRFTCTGANCSAATQGSVTFYVEGVTY